MAFLVGALLALAVGLLMRATGFDRDRSFYPTVTIVIASYYALFAVLGAPPQALALESVAGLVFAAAAIAAFRSSLWLAVLALAAHGVFDFVHGAIIDNPGVPAWWPGFCLAFDVTAAAFLAWLLQSGRVPAGVGDGALLEKAIAAYGEAWNRHDIEAILAMHTEDSVFENHTSGGKAVGKAAIRGILEGVFATFPDIHFDARRTYVRDGIVTQEWTATGTLAAPYTRGSTTVQPTGRKVSWNGVDVIPFRGTLVARKDVYVDSMSFLRALGFTTVAP